MQGAGNDFVEIIIINPSVKIIIRWVISVYKMRKQWTFMIQKISLF